MEGLEAATILLWTTTLALGGVVTAGTGAIDVDDDRSISIDVETDFADVTVENLGENDSPNATVAADGIDDGVERNAGAGLCAVGLDADESPVGVAVDGEESSVTVEPDDEYAPDDAERPHRGKTVQEIVDGCTTSSQEG